MVIATCENIYMYKLVVMFPVTGFLTGTIHAAIQASSLAVPL